MKGKITCPKCKHNFTFDVEKDQNVLTIDCPNCKYRFKVRSKEEDFSWEMYGGERKAILPKKIKRTKKPMIAAVLLTSVFILKVVSLLSENFVKSYAEFLLESGLLFFDFFVIEVLTFIFSIFALIGALFCFKRKKFYIALVCSILGIFSLDIFFITSIISVVALLLLLKSKDEFADYEKGKIF